MGNPAELQQAFRENLNWFVNSGVMRPKDGLWGVAERVVLKDNDAIDKIYKSFPIWTESAEHSVIEQRRADCNFQTSLLFLLASEIERSAQYRQVADHILDFLYHRSGLLNRFPDDADLTGTWFFSNIRRTIWFDDNSWNCAIALLISEAYPELEQKYDLKQWALTLANNLAKAMEASFHNAPPKAWDGDFKLPHWGALVCLALARAYAVSPDPAYLRVIEKYHDHLEEQKDSFIASEMTYALLASACCYAAIGDQRFLQTATFFGDKLISRIDPQTGNLPAEHHESPVGGHLVDTIYTLNWALLGFQSLCAVCDDKSYRQAFLQILNLLTRIQDTTDLPHLRGCWRGMYDLKANHWGGGDCYEGGANSIYTGWTNAPIALGIGFELIHSSLAKGALRRPPPLNPLFHHETCIMEPSISLRKRLASRYKNILLEDVIPFWLRHGLDAQHGGIITSLDRDGSIVDTDKGVWQQGRFAWLMGELYNHVEQRPQWLKACLDTLTFLEQYGFDPADGRMWFHLTRTGQPIRKRRYVFSEAFAAMAFGEAAQATGHQHYAQQARACFNRFITHADCPAPKTTDVRPMRNIAVPMITLNLCQQLRESIQLEDADQHIDQAITTIQNDHLKPELQVVFENVGHDGQIIDHFDGRTLNPGHAIEGAWFILHESLHRNDPRLTAVGCQMLDWMWERGWDTQYGGVLYFVDVFGKPVQEYWHDMKFWWPHNEAMIATLLAHELTGDPKYMQWHEQCADWAFSHFSDSSQGEWFGYLHRDGQLSSTLKGNLWKGAFHLPRMLLYCWKLLDA